MWKYKSLGINLESIIVVGLIILGNTAIVLSIRKAQ